MKVTEISGKPVFDAKNPLTIEVNEKDIAGADRKEPAFCAFARACHRKLHAQEVRIHLSRVYIRTSKGNWQRYMTPPPLRNEIIAFDRGGDFEPGTFTLSPPKPSARVTGKRQGSPYGGPRGARVVTGRKRRKPNVVKNVRVGPAGT